MTAPLNQLDWWRKRAARPDDPPIWRDAPRLLYIAAAVCLVVGSLIPWAVGVDNLGQSDSFRATQGTGEGVFLIAVALVLLFLARDRTLWETTSRSIQLLPFLLALLSLAMWLGAEHYANQAIERWIRLGGAGEMADARYVVGAGIFATLAGFGWLELRRPAQVRDETRPLWVEWGLTRWSAAAVISSFTLGILLAALAIALAWLFLGPEGILLAVILAVFGLFTGIGLGLVVAARLESRFGRR